MTEHTVEGITPEAFREPRALDPLTLKTLRTHLDRCEECRTGIACVVGAALSRVATYELGVAQ